MPKLKVTIAGTRVIEEPPFKYYPHCKTIERLIEEIKKEAKEEPAVFFVDPTGLQLDVQVEVLPE